MRVAVCFWHELQKPLTELIYGSQRVSFPEVRFVGIDGHELTLAATLQNASILVSVSCACYGGLSFRAKAVTICADPSLNRSKNALGFKKTNKT
jgi:hypothetical protein